LTQRLRQRYIQRVLGDERPTAARAKALVAAADLAADAGDAATVRRRSTEALELYRVVGDAWGSAYCVFLRAMSCAIEAEWEQGRELLAEAVRLFDELGDEYYMLETRRRLAWMYQNLGDVDRARAMHDENLRRARLAGNEQLVGTTSGVLAGFAMNAGRLEDALELLRDAIGIHRKLGDILGLLFDLHRSARLLFFLGRGPEAATRLLSKAAALHMEMDLPPEPWLAANDQQTLDGIHAKLDDAAFAEAWAQGERLTLDEAIELALDSLD
jgi:tetratricopeptide (TPR) repeat protein